MFQTVKERPLILLVDDAPANLQLLVTALKGDYRIKTATNGEAALTLARLADRPELILLDVMMPGLDGIEVMRRLRADPETAEIPVIFVSADDSERSQIEGLELGALAYLTKPINTAVLRTRIRTLLNRCHDEVDIRLAAHVFRHLGEAVLITDRENRIMKVNPAFTRLTGYSEEDVAGKNPKILSAGRTPPDFYAGMWRSLLDKGAWQGEVWDRRKDGEIYPKWLSISVVHDEKGELVNYIGSFSDITERKRMEELLLTQKLNAMRQLTGGIAHDFNNILGVILGFAEMVERQANNPEKATGYSRQIQIACERARRLTGKLLMFSRKDASSTAQAVDLNKVFADERGILEKTLTSRVRLKCELGEGLWPAWLDEGHLRDAVLNMAINAMHAMPEGGELLLRTENLSLSSVDTKPFSVPPGDYVRLTLADTGIGMDRETLQRVFEPFFTTKGDRGTGLGMSQVYGFVQQSKGVIRIYSEPGQGTCITILFPRYRTEVETTPQAAVREAPIRGGQERILVVDDDPGLRDLFHEFLKMGGYQVWSAQDGREALDLLEHTPIDLMLSDVVMPGMDGYQLASLAQKLHPKLRVQLISGFSEANHPGPDGAALHNRRLEKPIRSADLLSRIRQLLDETPAAAERPAAAKPETGEPLRLITVEELQTGIPEIDAEHQLLAQQLNRCLEMKKANASKQELKTVLDDLLQFTAEHFQREERILETRDAPNLEVHRNLHLLLLKGMEQSVADYFLGRMEGETLLRQVSGWLKVHVATMDATIPHDDAP